MRCLLGLVFALMGTQASADSVDRDREQIESLLASQERGDRARIVPRISRSGLALIAEAWPRLDDHRSRIADVVRFEALESAPFLRVVLTDPDPFVVQVAAATLGRLHVPDAMAIGLALLAEPTPWRRGAGILCLMELGDPAAVPALVEVFRGEDADALPTTPAGADLSLHQLAAEALLQITGVDVYAGDRPCFVDHGLAKPVGPWACRDRAVPEALSAAELAGARVSLPPPQCFIVDPLEGEVVSALERLRDEWWIDNEGLGFTALLAMGAKATPSLLRIFASHRDDALVMVAADLRSPRALSLFALAVAGGQDMAGVRGLGQILDEGGWHRLEALARHPSAAVRGSVAAAITRLDRRSVGIFIQILKQVSGIWRWPGENSAYDRTSVHDLVFQSLERMATHEHLPPPPRLKVSADCDRSPPLGATFKACPAFTEAQLAPLRAWMEKVATR